MREDVLKIIYQQGELKEFLREQPIWYRRLTRHPEEIEQFQIASLHFFEKTIPQRVEKFSNGLQMVSMMMHMIQGMYQS
ncbi:YlbE-like family protein [Heyndrickxia ginsengihumi]|uniref:YlbE-like protein n=1 Tax=Heyndrickxia ginsengihumi TaxID=363870 RepID=A0A0A6XX44_9BACI|nr:YlbE-like family protein [Heyndrickxia ginsengihumi]KHD84697.1 hypothetical protein NG54_13945 [Heyndrickxia ginsengihumi]MBE6183671.1 hypothetical protein [Bacillus sp. (in: firmicutes)]MCM3022381.1 YlbE-like family protein [Heyndrickxia ginsengihumi]NEY18677.1 hypothetical protein [Heyndrickxia ginsengihumi]